MSQMRPQSKHISNAQPYVDAPVWNEYLRVQSENAIEVNRINHILRRYPKQRKPSSDSATACPIHVRHSHIMDYNYLKPTTISSFYDRRKRQNKIKLNKTKQNKI